MNVSRRKYDWQVLREAADGWMMMVEWWWPWCLAQAKRWCGGNSQFRKNSFLLPRSKVVSQGKLPCSAVFVSKAADTIGGADILRPLFSQSFVSHVEFDVIIIKSQQSSQTSSISFQYNYQEKNNSTSAILPIQYCTTSGWQHNPDVLPASFWLPFLFCTTEIAMRPPWQ